RAIICCAIRQTPSSAKPDCDTWLVYSRTFVEDDDGNVESWGPWQYILASTDGTHAFAPRLYTGERLPICILRTEQGNGGFWPAVDKDVAEQVDNLNVSRSNEQHVMNLQGHDWTVYA